MKCHPFLGVTTNNLVKISYADLYYCFHINYYAGFTHSDNDNVYTIKKHENHFMALSL